MRDLMLRHGKPRSPIKLGLKKRLAFPILVYAIISIEIVGLKIGGFDTGAIWVWEVNTLALFGMLVGGSVKFAPTSATEGFRLGVSWALVFMFLDFALALLLFGLGYFGDWRVWTPYLLSVCVPTLFGAWEHLRGSR
jgi:hypothetical protein